MKEIYERTLSKVINTLCLGVGVFAVLPVMIGWIAFTYWLFKLFESEGVVLESYAWDVVSIGFMCFALVMMFLFTSIMESVDKELKKTYWEMKKGIKKRKLEGRKEC